MMTRTALCAIALGCALGVGGCFYPPNQPPLKPESTTLRLEVPYDLVWDAVNQVIKQNNYKVRAQNPSEGIIEAQATNFTSEDADCGQIKALAGTFPVDPTVDSSAVYNFRLKPDGPEASIVNVEATFIAPLRVPFHRPRDNLCASRGLDESRLLNEVEESATAIRRPESQRPSGSWRPSLLSPP